MGREPPVGDLGLAGRRRITGPSRPHHLGVLVEGRVGQDVPDDQPRDGDRAGHRRGRRRRRPRRRHGRRLHLLRPRAFRVDRRPDGARRGRRQRRDPEHRGRGGPAHLVVRRPARPRGGGAGGRGDRQVPPGDPERVRLRGRRRVRRLLGFRAGVLRPFGHDLPGHRPRRRRREAPVQGARHAADDRVAARAVPRRPEPRRLEGRAGRLGRRARDEDPGRRDDPVEQAGPDLVEQGPARRARRARGRRSRSRSRTSPSASRARTALDATPGEAFALGADAEEAPVRPEEE